MRLSILLSLVILSLVIYGCGGGDGQSNLASPPPVHGGQEGLRAEFENIGTAQPGQSGLYEVWEDEAFPVNINLQNKGEYSIPPGDVVLEIKGIAEADFAGDRTFFATNQEEIEKVGEFNPEGGEVWIDFGEFQYLNLRGGEGGTHYDANFFVFYTYRYRTFIYVPQVCYKYSTRDNDVCIVNEFKTAYASGGPFQVGQVEERFIGRGKIALEIPIYNADNGRSIEVIGSPETDFRDEWDEVSFSVDTAGWECRSRGNGQKARINYPDRVRSSQETTIFCTNSNIEQNAKFTRQFQLHLDYFYQDYIEQVVRVKANPDDFTVS